jgi:hypothetical protein
MRSISPQDVRSDLGNYNLPSECEDDLGCIARAGRYARGHLALDTRIAALGGTISVSMRLVDTTAQEEVSRVADPVSEDANERAQELHRLAVQLLSPDSYVGALQIKCRTDGAEVYLDDKLMGTSPLKEAIPGLRAGPHVLRITKPGFSDLYRFVDVVYKRSSTIEVDLSANTIAGVIVEEVSTTGFGTLYVAASDPGIEIRIDGEPKGSTLLEGPIEKVAAGKRRLSLHREGTPGSSQEIEIQADKRTDVSVASTPDGLEITLFGIVSASSPLPSTQVAVTPLTAVEKGPHSTTTWRTTSGLVIAGLGAVAFGGCGYYGWQMLSAKQKQDEIIDDSKTPNLTGDQWDALDRDLEENNAKGQHAAERANLLWKVGSGLMAVGSALVIWDIVTAPTVGELEPAAGPTSVVFSPLPGGGALLLGGSF